MGLSPAMVGAIQGAGWLTKPYTLTHCNTTSGDNLEWQQSCKQLQLGHMSAGDFAVPLTAV